MQEGATLDDACFTGSAGSCTSYAGFSTIHVDVRVPNSTYPTGYELNGLSNTGDWFQSVVDTNWCSSSGFAIAYEAFNSAGSSVFPSSGGSGCIYSMTIAAGDDMELGLSVVPSGTNAGDVCMSVSDLSTTQSTVSTCTSQPDPGSNPSTNYFEFGASGGFFTGPMTEIYDAVSSSCQSYGSMPEVSYHLTPGAYVTQFTPWSDEWYPPTSTICYGSVSSSPWTMVPGSNVTQVVDSTAASGYGPHWEAAQNTSAHSTSETWAFSTDYTLPSPSPSHPSMDVGQYTQVEFDEWISIGHLDSLSTYARWSSSSSALSGCTVSSSSETFTCYPTGIPGKAVIQFYIGESGGHSIRSPVLSFQVFPDPTASTPSAAPRADFGDVGQTLTFSTVASNGSGGYSYFWSGLPTGCASADVPSLTCIPAAVGTFAISVMVKDSDGFAGTSGWLAVTVHPALTIATPTSSVPSADVGGSVTFRSTTAGGAGADTFNWSLPVGCFGATLSVACTMSSAGRTSVRVSVTDSSGFTSTSPTLPFTVFTDPTVTVPTANRSSVDVGQAVTLSASVAGGSGGNTLNWTGVPSGCAGVGASFDCVPTDPGTFSVSALVTDSNQGSGRSPGPLIFVVDADPAVAPPVASTNPADEGRTVILSVSASSGSGEYAYEWWGLPTGCLAYNASSLLCTPRAPGSFPVSVSVTDSNGFLVTSASTLLTIHRPLSASLGSPTGSPSVGQSLAFSVVVADGTGPYTYTWVFGDGTIGNGSSVRHAYQGAGSYTIWVWVNDSAGSSVSRHMAVAIAAAGPLLGIPSEDAIVLLGIGVLAAVLCVILLPRHRRSVPLGQAGIERSRARVAHR